MPKPNRNPLVRVALLPPGGGVLTSVWAKKNEPRTGGVEFFLDCDGPETLAIAAGWHVEAAGHVYAVQSVEGARLVCTLVEGGAA